MVKQVRATQLELDIAVQALRDGELVAFPTETVYGLGANALHAPAVRKIFELKGRPLSHPLIVHLDSVRFLQRWARDVPEAATRLAEKFWPGPLTLVLPRGDKVNDLVSGGQDTVAVRVPAHPMALQLLNAFGGGIAAPSANRYGRVSPTRADHVREEFGDSVRVILDGGACNVGLESTIVACLNGTVRLLRPGAVSLTQLKQVVGEVLGDTGEPVPRVPGAVIGHYAPLTPLSIVDKGELDGIAAALSEGGQRIAVLAQRPPLRTYRHVTWVNAGTRVDSYAREFYNHLRTLDRASCARILVQAVPEDERWAAVRDRLQRAAAGSAPEAELPQALAGGAH